MKNETTLITADRIDTLGALLKLKSRSLTAKKLTPSRTTSRIPPTFLVTAPSRAMLSRRFTSSPTSAPLTGKSLAKELGISADIIAKYTKTAARFSVKVEAK
jgi:hypothetical protein